MPPSSAVVVIQRSLAAYIVAVVVAVTQLAGNNSKLLKMLTQVIEQLAAPSSRLSSELVRLLMEFNRRA